MIRPSGTVPPPEATIGSARPARPRAELALDVIGAGILAGLAATTVLASRGDRSTVLALLGGSVAVLVAGRVVGAVHRAILPGVVVVIGAYAAIGAGADLIGTVPPGGPFTYENGAGAFFVQVAFAGAMVAAAARRTPWVVAGAVASIASTAVAVRVSPAAASALLLGILGLPALVRPHWARPAVAVAGCLFLAMLMSTIVLGATYREGVAVRGAQEALRRVVTERRVALWHDSLRIMAEYPGGIGPGRFTQMPPRLLRDRDAHWAHNGFLHLGVELGWGGLIFSALLFLWGFARLLVVPTPEAFVAIGAASLAAFGIHASVDPLMHVPAVPLAAAALAGAAQSTQRWTRASGRAGPGVESAIHPVDDPTRPEPG